MDTKSEVISFLEEHRNAYASGQLIADHLHISRAAVWKTIQQLQKEGFQIEAVTRKGYRLHRNSDVLSQEGIRYYLQKEYANSLIEVYTLIDSTNKQLKKAALQGAGHHTILVANEQSNGIGRFERPFYSPKDTGIYMSLLIKDQRPLQDATMVTLMSGVAVSRVLAKHSE